MAEILTDSIQDYLKVIYDLTQGGKPASSLLEAVGKGVGAAAHVFSSAPTERVVEGSLGPFCRGEYWSAVGDQPSGVRPDFDPTIAGRAAGGGWGTDLTKVRGAANG